ncbi:NADH-quinone oxidoreductase subunit NuoF [Algisphaera agarilytica]|uniref:NADH-quinone oxidoreductase subunit F n=1 Tax=Algisphaera agarilytica TaxID=1385975 RepID=A0A7X0H9C4_9BACT|nr:NADH-quinone oxidoreductase subunit NuoF [Algisphaera agarilytica]MBB6431497.1 NADH-quinone oxidoreductase subunit F [Algisphaera agarilytica]
MPLDQPLLFKRIPTPPWGDFADRKYIGYDDYVKQDGYAALDQALEQEPKDIIETVKAAELRGRGGAGFPAGMKWSFLPPLDDGPRYLCINADESEPATFKDQILIQYDPHSVIEGIALCMLACQLDTAYFYIRGEYHHHRDAFEKAIQEAYDNNVFGPNSRMGKINGREPRLFLHRGAGAYICGEETGLIESLEGKRGWPRIKPPFPAVAGAFARPTIINNVETLANVPYIVLNGADWWKSHGKGRPEGAPPQVPASFGTKLIGISGSVNRPGVYEDHLGVKLTDVIEQYGQGAISGRPTKAYFHGGISMGVVSQEEAEQGVELDFDIGKKWANLGLGTACITVIPEDVSMVAMARNCAHFYSHESCGQCTHCREGSKWLYKLLSRIEAGDGEMKDLDLLLELAASMGSMPGNNICGLSDGANWAIRTIVNKFWSEFEAKVSKSRQVSLAVVGT